MLDEADRLFIERARAGDAQAVEALLERYQTQVYRFSVKLCGDTEYAKDVLQDTLLSMARGLRDFRGSSSISTWLYAIVRRSCMKKRRRSKSASGEARSLDTDTLKAAGQLADPAPSPDEALVGKHVGRALEQAISRLEPMYREVLLLRDVEGLSAPEVAEALGVTVQAVKSRLHRARLSVRAEVAPLLGVPTDSAVAARTCPDVLTLFSRYLEDELSADTCAEMEGHLQGCDRCRGACDSLKQTLALCRTTAPTVQVPIWVQASVKVALRSFLAENV